MRITLGGFAVAVASALALGACGSSDPEEESASCDYTETSDGTNASAAEATGIMVAGSDGNDGIRELCGAVNGGHYDTATGTIDADRYRITTDGMTDVVVRIFGLDGTSALPNGLEVTIFDTAANPVLLFGGTHDTTIADHGAFLAHLPAGDYDVVVAAKASGDLAGGTIPYKIRFTPDDPTRCPAITDDADYTEANASGNDVISVSFGSDPQFSAMPGTAEATGLTFDHDKRRISGAMDAGTATDDYIDRDTYAITTGEKTDELFLRLDWADAGTDLDFLVFEASTMTYAGGGLLPNPMEEYAPIAVKPMTSYYLWVGAHAGSTALPEPYDLAVCGVRLKP